MKINKIPSTLTVGTQRHKINSKVMHIFLLNCFIAIRSRGKRSTKILLMRSSFHDCIQTFRRQNLLLIHRMIISGTSTPTRDSTSTTGGRDTPAFLTPFITHGHAMVMMMMVLVAASDHPCFSLR